MERRIVVRSSSNIYNQSMMASIIAANGKEAALQWAEGIVSNMARVPKGNDRDQVKAVAAGNAVALFFPNQNDRGTHINVSGAGVAAYAPNKENAVKFLEYLTSREAQTVYAQENFEYPVREDVESSELVASWGTFKDDTVSLDVLGKLNVEAVIEFDKAGWK